MRKVLALFLALTFTNQALAGLPPTTLSGQDQTTKPTTFNFKTPYSQATKTSGINSLIETGSSNMLVNPGFEHETATTGWTFSTTGPSTASTAAYTTSVPPELGDKNLLLSCNGTSGGAGTCTYYQDVSTTSAVQGLVSIRIRAEAGTVGTVCPRIDGANVTAQCATIVASNTWQTYSIPTVLGATSTGVAVTITVGAADHPFVIADTAFVGPAAVLDSTPVIGSWVSYTPTFTGFGSPSSIECQHRQNGQNRDIRCKFTSGIATGVEARISLPSGDTSAGTGMIPSIQVAGHGYNSVVVANSGREFAVLIEPSVTYMTFSLERESGTSSVLTKGNGDTLAASGTVLSFKASVPLANLSGSANSYSSLSNDTAWATCSPSDNWASSSWTMGTESIQCRRIRGELEVRGRFTPATGAASEARLYLPTWQGSALTIDSTRIASSRKCGHAVVSTTSDSNLHILCTPSLGYVTWGHNSGGLNGFANANANSISTAAAIAFQFSVPITGWADSNIILGSFKEVVTTPGTSLPKLYSALVTDGAATTTISKEFGDLINGVCTNAAAGTYVCTFNSGKFTTTPNCWCQIDNADDDFDCDAYSETTTQVSLKTSIETTGTLSDANLKLFCHGE